MPNQPDDTVLLIIIHNITFPIMKRLILLAALLTAMTTWAQNMQGTYTVTNSGNTFTIERHQGIEIEIFYYRTVSLSAIAGVHFTEASGYLTFYYAENQITFTVTETPSDSIAEQYHFQTGTSRSYRFEVLDRDGNVMASCDRDITYGTDYQHTADYVNKSITDLVYFDNSGNIMSGSDNKYLDVAYSSSDWIKVTDAGYPQGVHTVSTSSLYHGSNVLRTYLDNQRNKMYATVYFTQKEEEDGYQYIQILADNSTTYDENDTWGAVYDPSTSIYKACFEMRVTNGFVTDEHYQFFPHRYDYVNKAAEIGAGLSRYSFDYDDSHLYGQKYQSSSYNAPNTGSLDLETTVNNLDIRFDAGGRDKDDWDFKDLKVRLALVDTSAPTVLDDYKVSGGLHCKGNTIYVSVPFSEIVTVSGTPTLSTTWGTLNYVGGSGSNVLTFSGTIGDDASGIFTVSDYSGSISDLAGNPFGGSISHSFDISVSGRYTITYDLAGGSLPEGVSNPETYTSETASFYLRNPSRPGYTFVGWTGSNGDTPQMYIYIPQGSEGDRSYTANWERRARYYTYDNSTRALTLIWGEYDKDNKWYDVSSYAVKTVTATSDVSFVGDCTALFNSFTYCDSIDLNNVNTSEMTNADYMFTYCENLKSLKVSNWDTRKVTGMRGVFSNCPSLTTLDLSGWNTEGVIYMDYMFNNSPGLTTIYVGEGWSTEGVTGSGLMFYGSTSLVGGMGTTYDESHIDAEYAHIDGGIDNPGYFTAMAPPRYTFDSETGALALIWGEFNKDNKWGDEVTASAVKSVTATSEVSFIGDCSNLFKDFSNCKSINLNNVNTSEMTRAAHMFVLCTSLDTIDLSGWNTANVTDMSYMFAACRGLTSLDVSGWNTGSVTYMNNMFVDCSGLTSLNLSGWNTGNIFNMCMMFAGCTGLTSIDVSGWNTGNVTDMSYMFANCRGLTSIDVSGWNTGNVTDMRYIFAGCSNLTTIYASEDWSTEQVNYSTGLFGGCLKLVGGMGTTYDVSHIDAEYAHTDGGPSNPGYFTAKSTAMRGDVNNDGNIDVDDVTTLIAAVLGVSTVDSTAADVNNDDSVDIEDVTALIGRVLNGTW